MARVSDNFLNELHNILPSDEVEKFLNVCFKPLKKSIRFVINKIDIEFLKKHLENLWWHFTDPGFVEDDRFPMDIFYVDRDDTSIPLGNTFVHKAGYAYIQEVAAALAARALDLKKWDLVLDMSAAPGGKATQIADYLMFLGSDKPWLVVANDVSKARIKKMAYNVNRVGAYNIALSAFNGFSFGKNLPEFFDHVLLDAPCSGEGTGFKSETALKFWRKEEINKIKGTQFQLLISAIKTLKKGWTLVYSTCTLNPYENELNVAQILEQFKGVVELEEISNIRTDRWISTVDGQQILGAEEAQKIRRLWPHRQWSGGFFIAKFRKIGSLDQRLKTENKLSPKNPFKLDMSSALQKEVWKTLKDWYGINSVPGVVFVASKELVYAVSQKFLEIKDFINFEKVWIPVLKRTRWYVRPTHNLGNIFGKYATKNYIILTDEQAQEYSLGKDLVVSQTFDPKTDYIILKWEKFGFSVGKIVGNMIKNKMIK